MEISDMLSLEHLSEARPDVALVVLTSGNIDFFKPDRIYDIRQPSESSGSSGNSVMRHKNHDQDNNNYNHHNHHGTTYFRGMEKVWLDLSASPFALRNIQDRVLFLENLVAPSMLMPYSYPWSAHLLYEQEEEKDTIARESSLLYVPNTRLSRVVRDLMKHLDLAQGDFVCLHLRLLEDFDSFCRDVEKQRQLFVPADFFWQAWRQGYSCAPSVSQILSRVSYHLFERHRKIFITTDGVSIRECALEIS
jgi:hypothetical protein